MKDAWPWQPHFVEPIDPIPPGAILLAAPRQRAHPDHHDVVPERRQGVEVIILIVTAHPVFVTMPPVDVPLLRPDARTEVFFNPLDRRDIPSKSLRIGAHLLHPGIDDGNRQRSSRDRDLQGTGCEFEQPAVGACRDDPGHNSGICRLTLDLSCWQLASNRRPARLCALRAAFMFPTSLTRCQNSAPGVFHFESLPVITDCRL